MLSLKLKDFSLVKNIIDMDISTKVTTTGIPTTESIVFFEGEPYETGKLYIGKYCSIASRTSFMLSSNHNTRRITTYIPDFFVEDISKSIKTKGNIVIGNDVWIGVGAMILSGVKIGTGAVIGAHAVVLTDVAPYSIVVGNPAKEIRKRFDDRQIKILLDSEWWNWDPEFIESNKNVIFSEDFSLFESLVKSLNNH